MIIFLTDPFFHFHLLMMLLLEDFSGTLGSLNTNSSTYRTINPLDDFKERMFHHM